ncbi:copper homeostasis protein CutC [Fimbriiglobus ruber]|uniref:PF03932 family protein CutC n=1 Tax=Fimbriiglobus ruber TaxID=1908690 RepID=A0A225ED36_9BACT|nr:copper homeostasis protein CutC [Fimbriiglobus ruber]OWK46355.1 Cytoplasmic copper homeostasis protein cutC [Fimbriiglobus ruber]
MIKPANHVLIEVAVESVADARAAEAGGAGRLELCAALDLDGLTPSVGAFLEIRAACRIPIVVMIRPRPGNFVYDADELRVMARDIEHFLPLAPDGFIFGPLTEGGQVNAPAACDLVDRAGGVPCVFHRAFDHTRDADEAVDKLAETGFARILTSGRAETAVAGLNVIARVIERAAGRIGVVPCGRIRAESAIEVVRATGCSEVHGSFVERIPVGSERTHRRTDRAAVAAARAALDRLANEAG